MNNPSYRIIGDPDADPITIEQRFHLDDPNCPLIVLDLRTPKVSWVAYTFPIARMHAIQRGLIDVAALTSSSHTH